MWLDPFQVDVLLSLSTKGNSAFVSEHLTSGIKLQWDGCRKREWGGEGQG